ncbi:melanoma-associated antigen 8 isoform X1 [Gossypium australe]|uniref:Melanoma-associated antigen 8 isoform X1 n=1 Tax=Gossypium australe TaxID=47621 RepID=A0A5B6VG19_9ROSI|nr:melanoma-associated antigen 8 isoform X1 [Gossypium australe]
MSNLGDDFSQFDISKEEKDKLVAEVVRYILFKTHQNSGCPIKREELSQLVTKNYRHRSLPAYIINEAKAKLSTIFGYELRELQRSRPSSTNHSRLSQQSGVDAKSYVIISQLPAEVYKKYVEDVNTSHLTGFTFVVISIVQLAGGKIAEDNLWHHLKRMGLHETDENHPVLGNVKQVLETLVQQRYLQKDKVSGPEGTTLFYELAERALDGTVSERIKQYISQHGTLLLFMYLRESDTGSWDSNGIGLKQLFKQEIPIHSN